MPGVQQPTGKMPMPGSAALHRHGHRPRPPRRPPLKLKDTDAALEAAIRSIEGVSQATKDLYASKLRMLPAAIRQATGGTATILEAISKPVQTYAAMTEYRVRRSGQPGGERVKPHTLHVAVSVVLGAFKHFPELDKVMPKDTRLVWRGIAEQTREKATGKYDDLEPTKAQRDAYVPFDRVIARRDELLEAINGKNDQGDGEGKKSAAGDRGRRDRDRLRQSALILSLYTMFPPRRSLDWAIMAVLDARDAKDAAVLRRADIDDVYPNRLVIEAPKKGQRGRNSQKARPEMRVVFTLYKTAKRYGQQRFPVPPPLVAVLQADLDHRPRRYLFENATDPTKSIGTKRFSEIVIETLKEQFPDVRGSPSIAMLRHSYIVAADVGNLTPRVAKALAWQMGHSRMQQLTYAYNMDGDDGDGNGGKPAETKADGVCQLVCSSKK